MLILDDLQDPKLKELCPVITIGNFDGVHLGHQKVINQTMTLAKAKGTKSLVMTFAYRYYQIAPWDAHREKVWEVVTEAVRMQERESKAGVTCAEVAYKVHKYQVEQGVNKLLYQRVAHGQGMEGHQPPYIALGDMTVLEEGMTFSVEPGLFDPENGFGYNPSDLLVVTKEKGVLMSSVPYSKEWMFLKL